MPLRIPSGVGENNRKRRAVHVSKGQIKEPVQACGQSLGHLIQPDFAGVFGGLLGIATVAPFNAAVEVDERGTAGIASNLCGIGLSRRSS